MLGWICNAGEGERDIRRMQLRWNLLPTALIGGREKKGGGKGGRENRAKYLCDLGF